MHLLEPILGVFNFLPGLIVGLVALLLMGIGIALGLVACGLAAVLLALGVISSSILVGVRSGRASSGIRAFLLQVGVLIGIPAGALCAWLAKSLFEAYGNLQGWTVMAYGAVGGAVAGVLVALMVDFISRRMGAWANRRLDSAREVVAASKERHQNPVARNLP
jgi:hypothetical protein